MTIDFSYSFRACDFDKQIKRCGEWPDWIKGIVIRKSGVVSRRDFQAEEENRVSRRLAMQQELNQFLIACGHQTGNADVDGEAQNRRWDRLMQAAIANQL